MAVISPVIAFVFRPGGTTNDNVFTDWPTLVTELNGVEGRKILEFDDSVLSPCVIPAGVWDMRDVMWAGFGPRAGAPRTIVRIQEGAEFSSLRMIGGQITIVNDAVSKSPISDFSSNAVHHIQIGLRDDCGNTQLINPGAASLFDLGANGPNKVVFFFIQNSIIGVGTRIGGQLVQSDNPLINNDGGVNCRLTFTGLNQTGNRLVKGGGVLFGVLNDSALVGSDNGFDADTLTGEIANQFEPVARIQRKVQPHPPLPPAIAMTGIDGIGPITRPNVLLRCNGNGKDGSGFNVELPNIRTGFLFGQQDPQALYTGGQEIVVAEIAGGNKLGVRAATGNTIDGLATPVSLKAHESRTFASDGVSNWITIASHRS